MLKHQLTRSNEFDDKKNDIWPSGGMTKSAQQANTAHVELSLDKASQGHSYMIISNSAKGRDRMHMDSLGLIPGDAVHVLFCNFSGLVVAIKGSRLALGRSIAACLTVREFQDSDWL